MSAASDSELVSASLRGERTAFGELARRYHEMVCAVSYSATGDRSMAEDVAQEAFIAAWSSLSKLREVSKLRPWLAGIARNLGRRARNKAKREEPAPPIEMAELEAGDASPLEATIDAESEALVWSALSELPDKIREAMVLYYNEQCSAADVAAILEISEDAVMQRLSRGRAQLKKRVTRVVESTLASRRTRAGFAAAVVAALPALGSVSHAEAATVAAGHTTQAAASAGAQGGLSMLKIGLIAAAVAGIGGGTYWVASGSNDGNERSALATAGDVTESEKEVSALEVRDTGNRGAPPTLAAKPADPQWITTLVVNSRNPEGADHGPLKDCVVKHFGNAGELTLAAVVGDGEVTGLELTNLEKRGSQFHSTEMTTEAEECLVDALLGVEVWAPSDGSTPTVVFGWRDDAQNQPDGRAVEAVSLSTEAARGEEDAPITIVVFHDFKCRFCGKVLGTIDELFDRHPGKLRLVVKQFPVDPSSHLAHEAALAAAAQGKFWPMHDLLMANQPELDRDKILALAKQAGLDVDRLARELDSGEYKDELQADIAEGKAVGVRATPSFLINGKRHTGARSLEYFETQIRAEL